MNSGFLQSKAAQLLENHLKSENVTVSNIFNLIFITLVLQFSAVFVTLTSVMH